MYEKRSDPVMETVNFIEKFIVYIEDHLREDIDFDRVLDGIGVEPKSFMTIFSSLVGMTPREYQLKRKMTEIAHELSDGHRRLVDIAKYYGYRDIETFKADYRDHMGISPYETDRHLESLELLDRISFEVVPVDRPKYHSTKQSIESFRIMGAVRKFPMKTYSSALKYEFLEYLERNSITDELLRYNNGRVKGIIMHERYVDGEMELTIGVASTLMGPFEETYTETGEFALFEAAGPAADTIQDIYRFIFRRWRLKETDELNCNFSIELLKDNFHPFSGNARVQVWQGLYKE